jgi:hypothetical protein
VIAGGHSTYGLIHLWASIATVDDNRFLLTLIVISTKRSAWRDLSIPLEMTKGVVLEMTRWGDHIPLIIPLTKHLQPPAEALQVLNMYVRRDISVLRFRTCFTEHSQRNMLGESCLLVNCYFLHNLHFLYDTMIW